MKAATATMSSDTDMFSGFESMPVAVKSTKTNSAPTPIRVHSAWVAGDVAHQGDLTLIGISAVPAGVKVRVNRQIAEGNTKGSRHVVLGGTCFDCDNPDAVAKLVSKATKGRVCPDARYIGPVFSGPCTLEHPQHQHQTFPADCVVVAVYQRNMDAEEREIRAKD